MSNNIDRFPRRTEIKFLPGNQNSTDLILETALYVPDRIAAKDKLPWISIYEHISSYIDAQIAGALPPHVKSIENIVVSAADGYDPQYPGLQNVILRYRMSDSQNLSTISATISTMFIKGISCLGNELTEISANKVNLSTVIDYVDFTVSGTKSLSSGIEISNLVRDIKLSSFSLDYNSTAGKISGTIDCNVNNINNTLSTVSAVALGSVSFNGLSLDYIPGAKTISAGLGYKYDGQESAILASNSIVLSNLLSSVALSDFVLSHDATTNYLSASLSVIADGKPYSFLTSTPVNLSCYTKHEETDPIFWAAERQLSITFDDEISNDLYSINLQDYKREQIFAWAGTSQNRQINLALPSAEIDSAGNIALYIEEHPVSSFYYVFADDNIAGYPVRKPWLSASSGEAIWKIEFDSIAGISSWYYAKATKYAINENPAFTQQRGVPQIKTVSKKRTTKKGK